MSILSRREWVGFDSYRGAFGKLLRRGIVEMAKGFAIRNIAFELASLEKRFKGGSPRQWEIFSFWALGLMRTFARRVVYDPHRMPLFKEYFRQSLSQCVWEEVGTLRKWYVKPYDFVAIGSPLYLIGSRVVSYMDWGCQSGQVITELCVSEGTFVHGGTVLKSSHALGYRNWLRAEKGVEVDLPDGLLHLFSDEPLCPRRLDRLREAGLSDRGKSMLVQVERSTYRQMEEPLGRLAQRLIEKAEQSLRERGKYVRGHTDELERAASLYVKNVRRSVQLFGD